MKNLIVKKIVSILACVSVLVGVASVSNASYYSIDNDSWQFIDSYYVTQGLNDYGYDVSYIYYDGMAVGAFLPNLKVVVDGSEICSVNTAQKNGPYFLSYNGYHDFYLHNYTGKHVSIDFDFDPYYSHYPNR